MSSALLTGASGLIAHQRLLEVVGHNIANVNTTGYKAQRAIFTDLFYETLSPATNPRLDGQGGTNPTQIGQGVRLSQIDRNFDAGALEDTGGEFDAAIEGDGFFVVTDGTNDYYTRAGKFYLDANGILVAQGGLEVKRLPLVGEPDGTNIGFQVPGESKVRVPYDALIPGQPSSEIKITGNLSNEITNPSPTIQTTNTPLETAAGVADNSALINDLVGNQSPYQAGDIIYIQGEDVGGAPISHPFNVSDTTTVGDLIDEINTIATGFQAELLNGNIVLTATENGPQTFSLILQDDASNVGAMNFSQHRFIESARGTDLGSVQLSTQIVDPRGSQHDIDLTIERTSKNTWRLRASIDPGVGFVSNNVIEPIEFNDTGELLTIGDQFISLNLNGFNDVQTLRISFDDPANLTKSSNQGDVATVTATADGEIPGTLTKAVIDSDGKIIGIDSNGRTVTIAQLAIASFSNPKGLEGVRDSLFSSSLNSGRPVIGSGKIRSGSLESSNVDVAFEFTRLIVAQRGFSANARTITVTDEVLEELTNIVR